MTYLLGHTAGLVLLALAVWLPGYAITEMWLRPRQLGALRPLARVCLGLTVWIVALFGLATVGQLNRPAVAIVAAAGAVAALWARSRSRDGSSETPPIRKRRRRWRPPGRVAVLLGAAFVAVLLPLFLLAVSPAVSWDANAYHLTVPRLYLEAEGFREIPMSVYSNWPLNIQMLFGLAMLIQDHVLAKLVHFGFGLLTLWTIFVACRGHHQRTGRTTGWIAVALFLANPVVAYEFHVAYIDLAHAFLVTAAFLFIQRAGGNSPDAPRALILAGLCCGLIAGTKLNGFIAVVILGSLYLPRLVTAERATKLDGALRGFDLRFLLPVVLLWLPWLIKSAWMTGNPIYPFVRGGPYWSPELSEALSTWHRGMGMGREPIDYLLLPLRVILAGGEGYGQFDGAIGAFWVGVLPVALWAAWRRPQVRRCLWIAGLYFIAWALSSQQMRLLIPILPLLAIAGATGIVDLVDRVSSKLMRPIVRRLALTAALLAAVWYGTEAAPGVSRKRYVAAASNALARYLDAEGDLTRTATHPVYGFINNELPPDARLLFLNTNQGFFCEREYLADSFFEASQIADWLAPASTVAELRELLTEERITHLLIEQRDWGIPYPAALFEMLRDPAQTRAAYQSPEGRFTVVELIASDASGRAGDS